jgi:hypothetical protein
VTPRELCSDPTEGFLFGGLSPPNKKIAFSAFSVSGENLIWTSMKREYNFSKGERGKFFRPNARIHLPIYLDEERFKFVEKIAEEKKADLTSVVDEITKGDKELAKTLT